MKEVNCLLANIGILFRYVDKGMFSELFTTYTKTELCLKVWSPHLKKHKVLIDMVEMSN